MEEIEINSNALVSAQDAKSLSVLDRFVPPQDADSLADALVAGQLSPRTRRAYASDLAELVSVLETWGLKLPQVNKDHLHAYRSWLAGEDVPGLTKKEKPCVTATVSRKVSVCRQFFAEALDRGLIDSNPAARLRGFSVSQDSKTLGLSRTAGERLARWHGNQNAARPAGQSHAFADDPHRTAPHGHHRRNVGTLGRTRRAYGSDDDKQRQQRTDGQDTCGSGAASGGLAGGRKAFREETQTTPLFCGLVKTGRKERALYNVYKTGQSHLSEKAIWKIVERRVKAAGITANITPHSTRHTFITLALDGGAPLHKVQVAAGHADPRTTERYWRTKENLDDNAVDYVRL